MACGLEARASSLHDARCARWLRLERPDGVLGELGRDAPRQQIVPDEGIPRSALGKGFGPSSRKTPVVDSAGPREARHDLAASRGSYVSSRQPLRELPFAQIAARE